MAVLAAAAFSTVTAAAHADVMPAGTWDGQITGGALKLGDGDLQNIAVPAGDSFTFTIPAGSTAPVAFKAPATHVPIPLVTDAQGGDQWAAGGSLDISPITGTVDPATGAIAATATAHGILHLDFAPATGPASSFYCHMGNTAAPPTAPAAPAPFALDLPGTYAAGAATLADSTLAVVLDCGFDMGTAPVMIIGHPDMPASTVALTASFTRRADPPPSNNNSGGTKPPATTTKPKPTKPFTPAPVQCVVPKLKGLKLKQARKAATKANCAVGTVKRKKSARKRTTVLKQGTAAGTVLAQGAKIKLTVAK
jgi:hypothetical protein